LVRILQLTIAVEELQMGGVFLPSLAHLPLGEAGTL
jgi:hypothetical protein